VTKSSVNDMQNADQFLS